MLLFHSVTLSLLILLSSLLSSHLTKQLHNNITNRCAAGFQCPKYTAFLISYCCCIEWATQYSWCLSDLLANMPIIHAISQPSCHSNNLSFNDNLKLKWQPQSHVAQQQTAPVTDIKW